MQNCTYEHFGVMLDMSRNAVMKVSRVKQVIDCLEKMGYNTLSLYCEDTYEIKSQPYFGYMRGRYTGAEIKEIDAYAKAHGIELVPCVQTLAHFTATKKNFQLGSMFDVNDILFVGEEKTYQFIEDIFKTIAEDFTSRNVNIGMDEAHFVGLGKYLDKNGYRNRFDILMEHLHKVAEIAKKYGFNAHMWSDMFFRLAADGEYYAPNANIPDEVKKMLPENVSLCYWDYYHYEKEMYDAMFKAHEGFNGEIWFAGGAWCWSGFAPNNGKTLLTTRSAMQSVREHGVKHVLITLWGDNGRECSPFALLPSLYAAKQYADGNFDDEKIAEDFYKLFGVRFDDFTLLDLPNKTKPADQTPTGNPCKALLYCDPFMGAFDKTVASKRPIPYAQYAEVLAKAAKRVGKFAYLFDMEAKLCHALAIKAELGVNVRRAYHSKDNRVLAVCMKNCSVLKKRLKAFHQSLYILWNKENKPQGWEVQDARIGGLIMRIDTCQKRLKEYISGKVENIPELEEDVLQILDGSQIAMNNYGRLVSFNSLHFGNI